MLDTLMAHILLFLLAFLSVLFPIVACILMGVLQ